MYHCDVQLDLPIKRNYVLRGTYRYLSDILWRERYLFFAHGLKLACDAMHASHEEFPAFKL